MEDELGKLTLYLYGNRGEFMRGKKTPEQDVKLINERERRHGTATGSSRARQAENLLMPSVSRTPLHHSYKGERGVYIGLSLRVSLGWRGAHVTFIGTVPHFLPRIAPHFPSERLQDSTSLYCYYASRLRLLSGPGNLRARAERQAWLGFAPSDSVAR